MEDVCHACRAPQCSWTVARCSNPTKDIFCRDAFCFKCLSEKYPDTYGGVFKGLCWLCPGCLGMCQCDICSDPEKKRELQRLAFERCNQQVKTDTKPMPKVHCPPRGGVDNAEPIESVVDGGWICPRCSVINIADDVECTACCHHRKRTSRKRSIQEIPFYEDKYHVDKETKRARDILDDDNSPPPKGRVTALRQLVKCPWTDGWEYARKLALDLVEEARQTAIKQGIPPVQVRQLPTKIMLANNRGPHVRKWFDREPTLAKKFLRTAGLICLKSNGTFIKEDVVSLEDLPELIRQADLSHYDEAASSGDDADGSNAQSSARSPSRSPHQKCTYQPKLKVYFHKESSPEPFVFKVPIDDLKNMDELQGRLTQLLNEMGQSSSSPLTLSCVTRKDCSDCAGEYNDSSPSKESMSPLVDLSSIRNLTRSPMVHVHAS